MASKYRWFGSDVSNKDSLFVYGLLMRLESRGVYRVCISVGDGDCYQFGLFRMKEWMDKLTESQWMNLARLHKKYSTKEYKRIINSMSNQNKALTLFEDLCSITDANAPIAGTFFDPRIYSENEVKIRLNKALGK